MHTSVHIVVISCLLAAGGAAACGQSRVQADALAQLQAEWELYRLPGAPRDVSGAVVDTYRGLELDGLRDGLGDLSVTLLAPEPRTGAALVPHDPGGGIPYDGELPDPDRLGELLADDYRREAGQRAAGARSFLPQGIGPYNQGSINGVIQRALGRARQGRHDGSGRWKSRQWTDMLGRQHHQQNRFVWDRDNNIAYFEQWYSVTNPETGFSFLRVSWQNADGSTGSWQTGNEDGGSDSSD